MDGSPAHLSHIVANRDYLIGCLQFEYQDVDEFSSKLSVYHGMEADPTLDLYVFNSSAYAGKFVKVKPSNLWKGEGLLGIEFGVGLFDNMQLLTILETLAKRELGALRSRSPRECWMATRACEPPSSTSRLTRCTSTIRTTRKMHTKSEARICSRR
jgi:hypothetical protein